MNHNKEGWFISKLEYSFMKKKSIIWTESKEDFQKRVYNCNSIADIVRSFGFSVGQVRYKMIYDRINKDGIDISHIPLGPNANKNRIFDLKRKPIEQYLTTESTIKSGELKKRLIRDGIMEDVCVECGLGNIWNNKKITLQLDHINGIRDDNRLENLRILCPNCHSQTPTFCGRDRGVKCVDCGERISSTKFKRCVKCSSKARKASSKQQKTKFEISKEQLEKLVWQKPTKQIAKDLGVSDNAVGKRCKKFNIAKPPRGYWMKVSSGNAILNNNMVA